jgi:hypothetical protein
MSWTGTLSDQEVELLIVELTAKASRLEDHLVNSNSKTKFRLSDKAKFCRELILKLTEKS